MTPHHNTSDFRPTIMNRLPVMMNGLRTVAYYNSWEEMQKGVKNCKTVCKEFTGIPCSLEELNNTYRAIKPVVCDLELFYHEVEDNRVLFSTLCGQIAIEYSENRIYLIAPWIVNTMT
ncbi:MAG: hypothetical protein U9N61_10420, partial [Euryarchaeota archaeon]|nr:hypothetical protein [Euryarchaeota archaeon]